MIKFHFEKVQNLAGFAAENVKDGDTAKVLTRAILTSDEPEFYHYSEQLSSTFLSKAKILVDQVCQFLVIIHQDLSADLYVNDFPVAVEIQAKRDIKAGEAVSLSDIADIRRIKFLKIDIAETDKIIYCFKVGWRFGLFFDLTERVQPADVKIPIQVQKFDLDKASLSIGDLYRRLSFYHVYKNLESAPTFDEMIKDGWFPFVEMLAKEYKEIGKMYQDKFDFDNRFKAMVDSFDSDRIKRITDKWWKNPIFADKKTLIEAGLNAYVQNTPDGVVNCIKNLNTEIEGLLRKIYLAETGKGDNVKTPHLISHIIEKAKKKACSSASLLLPLGFMEYLQNVVFANFSVESGDVELSRNSSSHGVAEAQSYTKARALQSILILDQIYFYC
jgi:hypothetical protein